MEKENSSEFFDTIPTEGNGWFLSTLEDGNELPIKVHYAYLDGPDIDYVAQNQITPDLNLDGSKSHSLSISINTDIVPEKFRRFVFIHELYEGLGVTHEASSELDISYAKRYLSKDDFEEYMNFKNSFK